jgi:hypothetical protein
MKNSPGGQSIFDGVTINGVHFLGPWSILVLHGVQS